MSACSWTRMLALAVVATTFPLADGHAQDADKRAQAEALNAEGKKLIKEIDLEGAAARFRAAMQLVDDPRYAFNLCYTLDKSGKLQEARVACQDVVASGEPRLGEKAAALLETIDAKLAASESVAETPVPASEGLGTQSPPLPPDKPVEPVEPRFAGMIGVANADVNGSFSDSPRIGLAAGGTMRVASLPAFDLLADVQYVQRGFSADGLAIGESVAVAMDYLDFGVDARYKFGQGQALQPFLELGALVSVLVTSSFEVAGMTGDLDPQPLDLATTLGAGLRVGALEVRARLLIGLVDINRSAVGEDVVNSGSTNSVTTLQLGYWF